MNILHLSQRYAPARGGAEYHLAAFSERLAADGNQVTVVTTDAADFELFWNPARQRIAEPESVINGVRVRRFPVRHLPLPTTAYMGLRRLLWILSRLPLPAAFAGRLSRFTPWVPDLWRWLAQTEEPFDLVAGMNISFEPLLAAGLGFARRRHIPFAIYPLTHLGAGDRPGQDAVSGFHTMRHQIAIVRASDAVIAQTTSESDFYRARGVPAERIHVVGPGVNPAEATGGDGRRIRARLGLTGPVVFSLAALSYDKGTVHLAEAMRRLWANGRCAHLVLAGSIQEPFQRYLDDLPAAIRAKIHILGQLNEADKRDLFAAADLFAMPSRTDSFGIVYLEAWLNQKPVMAADAWGVKDVIAHGEDGLLIPFGDVAALTGAIADLLDHPAKAQAMGQKGAAKVRQYHTWDRKYAQIRAIYQGLAR